MSTDALGRFDFGLQPSSPYTVGAVAAGYRHTSVQIDLREPNPRVSSDRITIRLLGCEAEVVGRIADADGNPITTGKVVSEAGLGAIAEADDRGEYRLCVAPGEVQLVASAPGYGAVVHVVTAAVKTRRDIVLAPGAVISGRVVLDGKDTGVAGALIRIQSKTRGSRYSAPHLAVSGVDGKFEVAGLNAGQYRLDGQAEGYVSAAPVDFAVNAAEYLSDIRCVLRASVELAGTVSQSGVPIVGAVVGALDLNIMMRRTAVTQGGGRFTIDRITEGPLRFNVEGYRILGTDTIAIRQVRPEEVRLEVAALAGFAGACSGRARPCQEQKWSRAAVLRESAMPLPGMMDGTRCTA
jgi:hypothetical protein